MCRTLSAHTRIGSIPDFLWLGVKLPIWLPTLLLPITFVANVQMAHARPFSTFTLQGLFNGIKNISRRGVLPSTVELWSCRSPGGLQVPTFGNVSLNLTLVPKWGCDNNNLQKYIFEKELNPNPCKDFTHYDPRITCNQPHINKQNNYNQIKIKLQAHLMNDR